MDQMNEQMQGSLQTQPHSPLQTKRAQGPHLRRAAGWAMGCASRRLTRSVHRGPRGGLWPPDDTMKEQAVPQIFQTKNTTNAGRSMSPSGTSSQRLQLQPLQKHLGRVGSEAWSLCSHRSDAPNTGKSRAGPLLTLPFPLPLSKAPGNPKQLACPLK